MEKTLQRVGVVALLLWTLAGFAAWALAAQRVRIVFEEGESERTAQTEVAQLQDRVDTLTQDLRGLAAAVEGNFEALVKELERDKEERRSRATSPVIETPVVSAEPEPVAEPEPARSRSFLSFQLPSDSFQFDEQRTFQVVSSLSRVGFDGKSTIHDFTGVAEKLEGRFTVNPARPETGISGELSLRPAGILTGSDGRDEEMYKYLDVEQYERIWFRFDSLETDKVDLEKQSLAGTVRGRMTIRGVEREIAMPVQGQIDESRRLVIEGEMPLLQTDFGIPVPSKLGMISMEDEVRVWIHVLARPMPREEKK